MYLSKVIIAIPFFLNLASIMFMMSRKPSSEQKYAVSISFANLIFLIGYDLFSEKSYGIPLYGMKIIFISTLFNMMFFLQVESLLFNIRIPRRIKGLLWIYLGVMISLILFSGGNNIFRNLLYKTYKTDSGVSVSFGPVVIAFFMSGMALLLFTIIVFIYRLITSKKKEKIFYTRNFLLCIVPVASFSFSRVDTIAFVLLPYMVSFFSILTTVLVMMNKFSNLSDQALSVVENEVSGPCFILDENMMVHSVNLSAVEFFPEYLKVRKMLGRPVKANDLLHQIVFYAKHNDKFENDIFEFESKRYKAQCIEIKSDYHLYGYTVVLKDITQYSNVVSKLEENTEKQKTLLKAYEDEISTIQSKIVSGAIQLVLSADKEIGEHMRRTSNYTSVIARQLVSDRKFKDILTQRYVEVLTKVSPLHDIGKIKTDKGLLAKPEKNSVMQDSKIQRHVVNGVDVIESLIVNNPNDLFYQLSKEVAMYHHEWWDGEGYPKGLKGYEIPLSARIVSVADVFDNISFQHFRESESPDFQEVFDIILSYSGKRFDPEIVDSFKNAKTKLKRLYEEMVLSDLSDRGGVLEKLIKK